MADVTPVVQTPQENKLGIQSTPVQEIKPQESGIDIDKLKEEILAQAEERVSKIKDEVSQEVSSKIVESLGGKDSVLPWEKEKRQPTPDELTQYVTQKVEEQRRNQEDERNRLIQTQQQYYTKVEKDNIEKTQKIWWKELDALRAKGKLPELKEEIKMKMITEPSGKQLTDDEKNDPGYKAQKKLFEIAFEKAQKGEINEEDLSSASHLFNLYEDEIMKDFKQPPGANAPVSMGRKQITTPAGNDYSYADIHNTKLEDLVAETYNKN